MYERKCIVCGKEYRYCSHCGEFNPNEKWRYLYCGHECKKIYSVCEDFVNDKKPEFDALKAQELLENLNIGKIINSSLNNNIKDIFSVTKKENNIVQDTMKNTRRKNKKSKNIVNEEIITINDTTLENPVSETLEDVNNSEDIIINVE